MTAIRGGGFAQHAHAVGVQTFAPAQGLAYTGDATDEAAVRTWVNGLFGA